MAQTLRQVNTGVVAGDALRMGRAVGLQVSLHTTGGRPTLDLQTDRAQQSCLSISRQESQLPKARAPMIYEGHYVSTCTKPCL